jgi:hypothetical protein
MSNNSEVSSSGVGLSGLVFIVFLILKLVGTIDWSWWWVTAPLWIPLAIGLVLVGILVIIKSL